MSLWTTLVPQIQPFILPLGKSKRCRRSWITHEISGIGLLNNDCLAGTALYLPPVLPFITFWWTRNNFKEEVYLPSPQKESNLVLTALKMSFSCRRLPETAPQTQPRWQCSLVRDVWPAALSCQAAHYAKGSANRRALLQPALCRIYTCWCPVCRTAPKMALRSYHLFLLKLPLFRLKPRHNDLLHTTAGPRLIPIRRSFQCSFPLYYARH